MRNPIRRDPRTPLDWLGRDGAWQAAARQGERLRALQQAVDAAAPPAMRLTVVALADGVLTLAAPHAAAASKLRQVAPSLKAKLLAAGWEVERFRLRASVPSTGPRRPPPRVKPPIPETGLDAIAQAAREVPEGPLKAALARLAKRHGRRA